MTDLDVQTMQDIVRDLYAARIVARLGTAGQDSLVALLQAVRRVYQRVAPEALTSLCIFVPVGTYTEPDIGDASDLSEGELVQRLVSGALLKPLPENAFRMWREPGPLDPRDLSAGAIVYSFEGRDVLYFDGERIEVANPTPYPTVFGTPTFWEIAEALADYKVRLARRSTCNILKTCWTDDRRYVLRNKPEASMRRSLENHLRSSLRGRDTIEVRPEQNMDETDPVDLKVTFSMTNRLAILEIKWLGKSASEDGTAISTEYADARALDGAQQLVRYLDENLDKAPQHMTKGYLVVFDARRRNSGIGVTNLSEADALYYSEREVEYDPPYHRIRDDMAAPSRLFMEPRRVLEED